MTRKNIIKLFSIKYIFQVVTKYDVKYMVTGQICTKRHFRTKTLLHEGSLLNKDFLHEGSILHESKKINKIKKGKKLTIK